MLKHLIHGWERRLAGRDNNRTIREFEWGLEFLRQLEPAGPGFDPGVQGDIGGGIGVGIPDLIHPAGEVQNGEQAKAALFKFNQNAIAKSGLLFAERTGTRFDFDGHWVSYTSPISTPYDENNTAYARYFPVVGRGTGGTGSRSRELERSRRRAVVVLPQWNADVDGHVAICRVLNRAGIAALRLSLPYHDRRMIEGFERADYLVSPNVGRTLQACVQAVVEARAAITWLIENGYERIGLLGTSIGSCIAFLTMSHDARPRAAAYNHVSSYFGDVVWDGLTTAHVRRGLESSLTREEVRRVWEAISPNSYVSGIGLDERPRMMISARYDLSFTPDLSRLLFDEFERCGLEVNKRVLPCGHYSLGKPPFKYYAAYLITRHFVRYL